MDIGGNMEGDHETTYSQKDAVETVLEIGASVTILMLESGEAGTVIHALGHVWEITVRKLEQ